MNEIGEDRFLTLPASGSGPGILVLHAWWGLNDFCRGFCQRLAEEGFVVLAPDLYHGQTAQTIPEAEKLRSKLKQEQVKGDILAAVAVLQEIPARTGEGLGLVGFSLGAYWGLWASLEKPDWIRAVVTFYGARNADYGSAQAAYLGHFAERDPYVAASGVKKMEQSLRAAGRPLTFYTYPGTGHWFFESDRVEAYQPEAAQLAWARSVEFFHARLGG
jgi:carboxymethylenebutenolidase